MKNKVRSILVVCSLIVLLLLNETIPVLALELPSASTTEIPHDVNLNELKKLIRGNNFAEAQRLFDLYSWQTFLAVNQLTEQGIPLWETWKESREVFLEDGTKPNPWNSSRQVPKQCNAQNDNARVITVANAAFGIPNDIDETDEAFSYPLWDQNGKKARYEIFLNKDTFDYILKPDPRLDMGLYNLNGQVAYSQQHGGKNAKVQFPAGQYDRDPVGAIELKLAWKVMGESDQTERYFTERAYVLDEDGSCTKENVGLIGMHIGHKTQSSPQWIWSTLEQVDNVRVNSLDPHGPVKPSFYDPSEPTLPANVCPGTLNTRTGQCKNSVNSPTQVTRLIPIQKDKEQLNHSIQQGLKAEDSIWQYYELIDTQWPTRPEEKPSDPTKLPESVTNKSGGFPTPVYLTNTVMETYFQKGNQPASNEEEGNTTCSGNQIIFGTESCMGCHSSAGIASSYSTKDGAVFNPQLSADFSWLLQQKAQWYKDK